MKRKRIHPKVYRSTLAERIFTAMDPAIADDTIVLYTAMRVVEGKIIMMMSIPNP